MKKLTEKQKELKIKNKLDKEIEEGFINSNVEFIKKVNKINWWEYIPVIGVYIYFAKINFSKVKYTFPIRKATTKYLKYYQHVFSILSLPFVIWTIYLISQDGWHFYNSQIGIIVPFALQFISPYPFKHFILKGLNTVK